MDDAFLIGDQRCDCEVWGGMADFLLKAWLDDFDGRGVKGVDKVG